MIYRNQNGADTLSESPAVSVVMSVYNAEAFLAAAVDSVLKQTFTDFEFIIIDDASDDESAEILRSFDDPRIRLYRNDVNLGLTVSLNRGLRLARGKYVARLDADDFCKPQRLGVQHEYLEAHPECAVLGSAVDFVDEKNEFLRKAERPTSFADILASCFFHNPCWHSTVMFRRVSVTDLGGYDESFERGQDYDLWLRMIAAGREIRNLPLALASFRMHESKVTYTDSDRAAECRLRAVQRGLQKVLGIRTSTRNLQIIHELRMRGHADCTVVELFRLWMLLRCFYGRFKAQFADLDGAVTALEKRLDKLIGFSCRDGYLRESFVHPYVKGKGLVVCATKACVRVPDILRREVQRRT